MTNHVCEVSEGYLTAGWSSDSLIRSFTSLVDWNGEELWSHYFQKNDTVWEMSLDINARLNDTTILIAAVSWVNSVQRAFVFWLNESGDSIQTRSFASPYLGISEQSDWMRPLAIDVDPQQNIYISCQLFEPETTDNDFVIMKLNSQGDSLWSYIVAESGSEYCYDIQAMEDGVLIAGGGVNNNSSQTFIKLNQDGELQWQFDLDEGSLPINIPNEIIAESDGIIVACEYTYDGTSYRLPVILKTNYEGTIQWVIPMEGNETTYQYNNHLVKALDGGYLSAAWQYEEDPEDPDINGNYNWNAWLIKVSATGELEWERFYHFIESTNDKHRVYDLKATSDGGYIFCGDAIDENLDVNGTVIQKGWLVKVDACGCLVPGCDENCIVGVEETEERERNYFKAGPNPATQYLNIYLSNNAPTNSQYTFQLHTTTGILVKEFAVRNGNTTYIVDVEKYKSGNYVLSLSDGLKILQSEIVFKE